MSRSDLTLPQLLRTRDFEHSLLLGYYGGGNYGDELLLEVLANLLKQQGVKHCTIGHQDPSKYHEYHQEFGYPRINMKSKAQLLGALFSHKNIVVGGGGLWGVDMNFNTLLMSVFLWVSRRLLGKRVYLLGVGYYNSTNRMGRIGAWFAAKASTTIIARDRETLQNFGSLNNQTYLDHDMSWYIRNIKLEGYKTDVAKLEKLLPITGKTAFITLRRSQATHQGQQFAQFNRSVETFIKDNPGIPVIIGLLESKDKSPEDYELAYAWRKAYPHVQVLDRPCNPLTLFLFFQKYQKHLALIGPQFHIIITAYLTQVPFLPMVYDNKVEALLEIIGVKKDQRLLLKDVKPPVIQSFAVQALGDAA